MSGRRTRKRRLRRAPVLLVAAALAAAAGCAGRPGSPPFAALRSLPAGAGGSPAAAAIAAPRPALSGDSGFAQRGTEFRVGLRALFVPPPSEEADILDHGTGDGFFIVYRGEETGRYEGDISFEVVFERSAHEETGTGRAAEYWRGYAGFRWVDAWTNRAETFLSAGGSYSQIEVPDGDMIAGLGIYGGVGIALLLTRSASVMAEVKLHRFWASIEEGSGGGIAVVLAVAAGLRF